MIEQSVHKIPSTGPPTIPLQLVPKILKPLVSLWVPKAFVISFKLETDETLLIPKARGALENYNHNVSDDKLLKIIYCLVTLFFFLSIPIVLMKFILVGHCKYVTHTKATSCIG